MPSLIDTLILFGAGLIGGTAAGLFGIGGGVIYVLAYNIYLIRNLGDAPDAVIVQLTILNAACSILFAAALGSYRQHRHGNFHRKQVIAMGLSSAAGAFVTTRLVTGWPNYDQDIFLIVFTLALIPLILKFIPKQNRVTRADLPLFVFPATGLVTGIGSALSGLGGGFMSNPVLHGFLGYPLKKTFSVSLGSMIFTTAGIIGYHLLSSSEAYSHLPLANSRGIVFPLILPVMAGVMFGTPLGVRMHHRLPARMLSWLFILLAGSIVVRNLVVVFR